MTFDGSAVRLHPENHRWPHVIERSRRIRDCFVVERPMPASTEDIAHLKSLLKWAKMTGAKKQQRDLVLAEALEKAIGYLEEPDRRRNIVGYVLAALHRSMRHVKDGGTDMWIVVDRELHTWAMGQIEAMFPHEPGTDPVGEHENGSGKRTRRR